MLRIDICLFSEFRLVSMAELLPRISCVRVSECPSSFGLNKKLHAIQYRHTYCSHDLTEYFKVDLVRYMR